MNTSLASVFHVLVAGLRGVIAPVASRDKARAAFFMFIWNRIGQAALRFEKLVARWKSGSLPKPRQRAPRPAKPDAPARKPLPFYIPKGRAWLQRALNDYEVDGCRLINGCRSQFLHTIASAEMREFLEAAPQARRILNPFCRMLGMNLDAPLGVPLPPGPPRPEPPKPPRRSAPRAPRRPPDPPVAQPARLNLIEFFSSS